MRQDIMIRPETPAEYEDIDSMVLRSFREGTDYSDGSDVVALIEEIRCSRYYIPELSFVAEQNGTIVGHFLFSRFPLSRTAKGGYIDPDGQDIVMLAPVAVHADYLREGIGSAMLTKGIDEVRQFGFRGITVEGDFHFYNRLGFRTSAEFGIYPSSGIPLRDPRCMMCQELYDGALHDIGGYVVYDMYRNA